MEAHMGKPTSLHHRVCVCVSVHVCLCVFVFWCMCVCVFSGETRVLFGICAANQTGERQTNSWASQQVCDGWSGTFSWFCASCVKSHRRICTHTQARRHTRAHIQRYANTNALTNPNTRTHMFLYTHSHTHNIPLHLAQCLICVLQWNFKAREQEIIHSLYLAHCFLPLFLASARAPVFTHNWTKLTKPWLQWSHRAFTVITQLQCLSVDRLMSWQHLSDLWSNLQACFSVSPRSAWSH